MTYAQLKQINEGLGQIDIKGKKYTPVTERVNGFRQGWTNGRIETQILSMADGEVIIQATIKDVEGNVLSTGIASEEKGSSFINKTSYIENCETSAIGRALGFLGIGIDESMASAEEVANAMTQQNNEKRDASDTERAIFEDYCKRLNVKPQDVLRKTGWKQGKMTVEHYGKALIILKEIDEGRNG